MRAHLLDPAQAAARPALLTSRGERPKRLPPMLDELRAECRRRGWDFDDLEQARMATTLLAPTLYQLPASATFNTFTTIQDISVPTNGQAFVLQPNQLGVGQTLALRAAGVYSTTGTPNLTLGFYYGGVAGVTLAATAATATPSGAANLPWILEWEGTVQSIGATGTIIGQGVCHLGLTTTSWTVIPIPNATPQTALTINTQLPKSLGVAGTWSASSISNTITTQTFRVVLLG